MNKKSSKIGPHEGIEFSLMIAGKKNVALFFEIMPENYKGFTGRNGINAFEFESTETLGIKVPIWIVYRDGFQDQARELQKLISVVSPLNPEKERRIGKILSYTDDEVQAYIDQF